MGRTRAFGTASRTLASSCASGSDAIDHRDLRGEIDVDGLTSDHEPTGRDPVSTRDPHVHDGRGRIGGQAPCRRGCRLDGADPARQAGQVAELDVRRSDEQDICHGLILRRVRHEEEHGMHRCVRQPLLG